jgi:hypothetical protein
MQLGTLMHEWQQEWTKLHGYYKDAGRPEGTRDDLRPGLIAAKFDAIKANSDVSDNTVECILRGALRVAVLGCGSRDAHLLAIRFAYALSITSSTILASNTGMVGLSR